MTAGHERKCGISLERLSYEKAVEWMDKNAKDNDELHRSRREAEELLEIKKK